MRLFHGTHVDHLVSIVQRGLRPGSFLADDRAVAERYATWRTAGAMESGGRAVGLLVVVELDATDRLEADPFAPLGEPGQHRLPDGCGPARIVDYSTVETGWTGSVWEFNRHEALAHFAAMERVRERGQVTWSAATAQDAREDMRRILDLRAAARARRIDN